MAKTKKINRAKKISKNRELEALRITVNINISCEANARSVRAARRASIKEEYSDRSTPTPATIFDSNEPSEKRTKIKEEARNKIEPMPFNSGARVPNGTLVFAKIRGYRPWPAKVIRVEARNVHVVLFFGSNEIGNVTVGKMYSYCEITKNFFGSGTNSLKFERAMQDIERDQLSQFMC